MDEQKKVVENPQLTPEVKEEIAESMKQQAAPEKDVEREKLEDVIKDAVEKVKVEDAVKKAIEPEPIALGPTGIAKDKTEEEKQTEQWVKEGQDKPEKGEEPLGDETPDKPAEEITDTPDEPTEATEPDVDVKSDESLKEKAALEAANKRKFDICPFCGTHAMDGAIQPKIPLPIGDQAILIALPMLICIRCTNAFMPRSFVQTLMQPETEKPKIITP